MFCCPICSLICSQLFQFAIAEAPQTVMPWIDSVVSCLSLSEGLGTSFCFQHISFSCSGSAEILLLSALLAQRELNAPGPSVCPMALFLSGGYSCLPLLSAVPCFKWLHWNPWEHRQLVDVPCYQHSSWPAFHTIASVSGMGHCRFEGFSYSWLFQPCVMEEQCQAWQ